MTHNDSLIWCFIIATDYRLYFDNNTLYLLIVAIIQLFVELITSHKQMLSQVLSLDEERMKKQFEDFSVTDVRSENNGNYNDIFAIYIVEII